MCSSSVIGFPPNIRDHAVRCRRLREGERRGEGACGGGTGDMRHEASIIALLGERQIDDFDPLPRTKVPVYNYFEALYVTSL